VGVVVVGSYLIVVGCYLLGDEGRNGSKKELGMSISIFQILIQVSEFNIQ